MTKEKAESFLPQIKEEIMSIYEHEIQIEDISIEDDIDGIFVIFTLHFPKGLGLKMLQYKTSIWVNFDTRTIDFIVPVTHFECVREFYLSM